MADMNLPHGAAGPPGAGLTRREAAEFLGVCEQTLRDWEAAGIGPAVVRVSSRRAFYPKAGLVDFIKSRLRGGTPG